MAMLPIMSAIANVLHSSLDLSAHCTHIHSKHFAPPLHDVPHSWVNAITAFQRNSVRKNHFSKLVCILLVSLSNGALTTPPIGVLDPRPDIIRATAFKYQRTRCFPKGGSATGWVLEKSLYFKREPLPPTT